MAGLLNDIRKINGLSRHSLAEPFAGGAGASLALLYLEEVQEIFINDADINVSDFWWAILRKPAAFIGLLEQAPVDIDEWLRQRKLYRGASNRSRVRRGFATFYLNRCNRSGIIINGGPIGGIEQNGKWKLDARFNKLELKRRCLKVAEYAKRIHLTADDGLSFLEALDFETIMAFIDPPYFGKGGSLYMNSLNESYHSSLADFLKSRQDSPWLLTYDDCPEIRNLYSEWAHIRPFSLQYAASRKRRGAELLISPKWIRLPNVQRSSAIQW